MWAGREARGSPAPAADVTPRDHRPPPRPAPTGSIARDTKAAPPPPLGPAPSLRRPPPPPRGRQRWGGWGGAGATLSRSLPVVLLVLAGVDLGTFGELLRAAAHLGGVLHGGAAKSAERRRPARARKWRRKRSGHRLRRPYIEATAANQRLPGNAAAPPCGGASRALRWLPPWACCRCRRGCAPSCWTWRAPPPPSPSCRCAAPGGGGRDFEGGGGSGIWVM